MYNMWTLLYINCYVQINTLLPFNLLLMKIIILPEKRFGFSSMLPSLAVKEYFSIPCLSKRIKISIHVFPSSYINKQDPGNALGIYLSCQLLYAIDGIAISNTLVLIAKLDSTNLHYEAALTLELLLYFPLERPSLQNDNRYM